MSHRRTVADWFLCCQFEEDALRLYLNPTAYISSRLSEPHLYVSRLPRYSNLAVAYNPFCRVDYR